MSDDFELFVVGDGTDCFWRSLNNEKVRSNLDQSSEFVYVCRSKLWYGGEDSKGGFGAEPMHGEECLE